MANEVTVQDAILALREPFESVKADKDMNFAREAEFAVQVLYGNDYLLKVAKANVPSLESAVMNIASIGLSLNPAKKQAYLVPRKGKICLDVSYMGLMDLATSTGSVMWAQAAVVYANDSFQLRGYDHPPLHERDPFAPDRGAIVGVYCVAKTRDGDYLTHTMSIAEVYAIRDRSESWKADKATPWKTDEVEMIKKTCVKQACKYWPRVDRLDEAIHHLNTELGEGLASLAKPAAPPADDTPGDLLEAAVAASKNGVSGYAAWWGSITKEQRRIMLPHHQRLKESAERVDKERTVDAELTDNPGEPT